MSEILKSASKIVFLAMAVTVCAAFLYEILMGKISLESKDFIPLVMMAFTFYFASKPSDANSGSIK